ncbi:DUF2521 domain-containing protein [Bacillaceae bacterium ZC4]|uniref:DUF2521 family protein n=1 Tax=unclassified Aeribacillus TaxID=2640495 RepID=UPI00118C499A|nr:DUF2521 domain-containing protein [Bacillaceae bacterium ZC4]MDR9793877.1 DUF2521 family protein [Aeribacillus pallidus]
MNVITDFNERRQEKKLLTERKMLKDLAIRKLKNMIDEWFNPFFQKRFHKTAMEEECVHSAIESFLLGAAYSRFGYYGESMEQANTRCIQEEQELINNLFDNILYLARESNDDFVMESIYLTCQHFIHYWWEEGFLAGKKRYKLKL